MSGLNDSFLKTRSKTRKHVSEVLPRVSSFVHVKGEGVGWGGVGDTAF